MKGNDGTGAGVDVTGAAEDGVEGAREATCMHSDWGFSLDSLLMIDWDEDWKNKGSECASSKESENLNQVRKQNSHDHELVIIHHC